MLHPLRKEFLESRAPKRTLEDFLNWLWDPETAPIIGAGSFSNYGETHLLDHILGKTAFTMPASVNLALATVVPTVSTTGATITEANYTGYARVAIAAAGWNAAVAGTPSSSTNAGTITFGNCTAGSSTVVGWMLVDSGTLGAGNALVWGSCTSVTISTTQTPPTIAAGALQVTLA